jgi:hypothetical protein
VGAPGAERRGWAARGAAVDTEASANAPRTSEGTVRERKAGMGGRAEGADERDGILRAKLRFSRTRSTVGRGPPPFEPSACPTTLCCFVA